MPASISFQAEVSESGADGTLAFTVASASGQERLLYLMSVVDDQTTATVSSVAIDGEAATQIGSFVRCADTVGNGAILSVWRAAGTAGTTISVTYSPGGGSFFDTRGIMWSLNDAGTLLDSATAITETAVVVTLDVDTVTDGVAAAAMLAYSSSTHVSTWSGLTERFDGDSLYGIDWVTAADLDVASGSTPLAVTATVLNWAAGAIVAMAVSFNPAAGGVTLTAADGSYTQTGTDAPLAFRLIAEGTT